MAYTSLSNIIEPKVFAQYVAEQVTAKSALLSSGAIVTANVLNEKAASGGSSINLPFFGEFAWAAPDIAKDDTTVSAVASVQAKQQIGQTDYISKTWGAAALAASVSGADIMGHIGGNVVAPYLAQTIQQYALSKLSGVLKDNIANDSGDMVKNVATDAVGAAAAAELANVSNVIEAIQTLGDARDKVSLIIMHSRVYSNLLKLEPTNFDRQSATVPFTSYMGMRVIIDDTLPAVAGTNRTTYSTYILGQGALMFGEAAPEMGAVAVKRNDDEGNGFGAEKLIVRKQMILHPAGFASSAAIASNFGSPTLTAYDTAASWDRVVGRKNVPLVCLKTNG